MQRMLLLRFVCFAAGLCATGYAQFAPPSFINFSPTQAAAGSSVIITFSGANFVARSLNLSFSPSQGITVTRVQVVSPAQIMAQVQIDSNAQPGARQVTMVDADKNLHVSTPFTITPAGQGCPPGTPACGPNQPSVPALREFSPLQGTQGTTVALTLAGANFSAPASLQLMPNSGITVQSVTVTNANEIRAQVLIAPNASLGARGVILALGKRRLTASNTFTVVSGASLAHMVPMQILRVVPNQIAAGSQNVDLTLQGTNFVPGTQVTFTVGAGVPAAVIANGAARYVNSTEIHVITSVLPTALPGGRDINLQGPGQQTIVGKGMLSVLAAKQSGLPTVLKIPPITLQNFPLAIIHLDAPLGAGTQTDQYVTYTVPMLDDASVFKWHEQNPGLADYYELRIYAKDGKTLLATQKITGTKVLALGGTLNVVPTYYRPDPAFLKEVLEPVRRLTFTGNLLGQSLSTQPASNSKAPIQIANSHGTSSQTSAGRASQTATGGPTMPNFPPDQLNGQLSQGEMQWEVAGFHTYNKSGVAPQSTAQASAKMAQNVALQAQSQSSVQGAAAATSTTAASSGTVDLEVEISDRWPLKAPVAPTGMACSESGMTQLNLQAVNISSTSSDPNNYVGDKWALQGNIDLSHSPYQTQFTPQTQNPPGCTQDCFKYVAQVQFNNVFVDWGDGTVQALTAPPATPAPPASPLVGNWDPSQQLSLPMNATSPMQHAYQSANSYKIRVFQLSEEDLQHVSVSSVSASVDGPTTPFMQTALLSKLATSGAAQSGSFTQASVQSGFQQILLQGSGPTAQASSPQGPSPAAQVASDAYMVYCHTVNIRVPEDLAADGPLHLMGIADPDFGAYDVVLRQVAALGGAGRVSLSNQGTQGQSKENQAASSVKPVLQEDSRKAQAPSKIAILPMKPGSAPVAVAAICSTCDDGMEATSYLNYYGTGQVLVTWTVDGVQSQQNIAIPPSQPRLNLVRQGFTTVQVGPLLIPVPIPEPPIIISQSNPLYSPALQMSPVGDHIVSVRADVLPDPSMPNLSIAVGKAVGSLVPMGLAASAGSSGSGSSGGKQVSSAANVAEAQSLLNTLAAPAGSNLPPLKVGILSPSNQSSAGLGAVQYINGPLQQAVAKLANSVPDQHVASNVKTYEVVASDPKKACKFLFPVKSGGAFEISGLQNHVTQQGTTYNGTGNLIIHMANGGSQGYDEYSPIAVKISNWNVPDGLHVQDGAINVSPNLALEASLPALKGTIVTLSGKAGIELDATLNVTLSDTSLRLPGERPVSWSGVTSELHANGDWMKDGLTLPTTLIGYSAFTMQSNSVRFDLSHDDGDAANILCGTLSGGDWVGVRFPSLTITPYTMDLVSTSALQLNVPDWGIAQNQQSNGLCGSVTTLQPFTANLGAGTLTIASISATAFDGIFTAQYKGMDVYVPWLDAHLKGDATLLSGGGKQANITFPLTSPPVSKTYGNFAFTANNLQFTKEPGIGWVVQTNTHFIFSAENQQFAAFDQVFYFGMDGRGYLGQGNQATDIPLGGSSHLGQTPVDLASVHLTFPPSGTQVMAALFNTNVHLSEVMAAALVQVNYQFNKVGTNYSTAGPTNSPFTLDVPYPAGQPSSEAKVHPVYSGTSGSEYSGTVDLSELGGPPITGEFRLGYQGGHDYWLTRVSYPLGPTGVVLIPVPPVMNLYRVQGGIGHNFPISAFEDTGSLSAATPVIDNSFLFMAGIRVGMPDQFTYTLDGDLVIKSSGQDAGARMDFHSWLLKPPDNSEGDFQGYFQYAGSNFDGRLWGHLNFMGGIASVDMGNSASNAAVDIHFGPSGPWHVDAGKQQGPRIDGHLLFTDANMYVMLSDSGLSIGGGESINLDVGDDSVASAYVRGDVDMGLTITPQPHISGNFSASVGAGVCVDNVCVSAGVTAQIQASALPLDVEANASIGLPWPLGSISFSVHL